MRRSMVVTTDNEAFIPQTMEEAAALAARGAEVLPLIQAALQQPVIGVQRRACLRVLALLGTSKALELLREEGVVWRMGEDYRNCREELWVGWQHTPNRQEYVRQVLVPMMSMASGLTYRDVQLLEEPVWNEYPEPEECDVSEYPEPEEVVTSFALCGYPEPEEPVMGEYLEPEVSDWSEYLEFEELDWSEYLEPEEFNLSEYLNPEIVTSLEGLQQFGKLLDLDLNRCVRVQDISPLMRLSRLQWLSLEGCTGVQDLSPLVGLGQLHHLILKGCTKVHDLSPLAGLSQLYWLDLSDTHFQNADLTEVDLTGAKLRNADLTNARLTGAILRKANLRGAHL